MTQLLCASPRCHPPGNHATDCDAPDCRGCLPALAADGLRLCWHCAKAIGKDAITAGRLHSDLAACLLPAGTGGGGRGVNPQPGLDLSPRAVEARAEIRAKLVSWTLMIAEERGWQLPGHWGLQLLPEGVEGPPMRTWVVDDTVPKMAEYVARCAPWLAAHPAADDAADEMAELVSKARAVIHAGQVRIVHIGPCPAKEFADDGSVLSCAGRLKALLRDTKSLVPSEVACDTNEQHNWTSSQWMRLGRDMAGSTA